MKYISIFLFAIVACNQGRCQNIKDTNNVSSYYRHAIRYKNGNGVAMDYQKAIYYFDKAARLGDPQSVYALAYMHYKGLGCSQDYVFAASLFRQGALLGKDNSMYFYGLCLRNGYGVPKNEDSARFWLKRSSDIGYMLARNELDMKTAENGNDSAKALVIQINNAAMPDRTDLNKFKKIDNHLPSGDVVEGSYSGYLITYDWSGQNPVSAKKLLLNIEKKGRRLTGGWTEEGTDSVPLEAFITNDSLVFSNMHYGRKDHYSPGKPIKYNFKDATFNLVQKGDSVFLAGNIAMFSPDRAEPSKPLFVALARMEKRAVNYDMNLRASPNPFSSIINVEFSISKDENVEVQLLGANGAIAYRNPAGRLSAGHYLLPVRPGYLAPGAYMVKVVYGLHSAFVKVVRAG